MFGDIGEVVNRNQTPKAHEVQQVDTVGVRAYEAAKPMDDGAHTVLRPAFKWQVVDPNPGLVHKSRMCGIPVRLPLKAAQIVVREPDKLVDDEVLRSDPFGEE